MSVPPIDPPDAATATLLTSDEWKGFTFDQDSNVDLLVVEFVSSGVDVIARVFVNGFQQAQSFVEVDEDRISFEASNDQGDEATFVGALNRGDERLQGTFVLRVSGFDISGNFIIETPPDPLFSGTASTLVGTWEGTAEPENGGSDRLQIRFIRDGVDILALVAYNDGFLGLPHVSSDGTSLFIAARDHRGNSGSFTGVLQPQGQRIDGTFSVRIDDESAGGDFTVFKFSN